MEGGALTPVERELVEAVEGLVAWPSGEKVSLSAREWKEEAAKRLDRARLALYRFKQEKGAEGQHE